MPEPPVKTPGNPSAPLSAAATSGVPRSRDATAAHWATLGQDVMRLAKAGDTDALGRFFDHYFERVFSVVRRFVHSTEEAQDLTQDVFLRVRRSLARIDVERDPAPWLFTVAVNMCRDHRRSAAWRRGLRTTSLDHDTAPLELPDEHADPQRLYLAAQRRRRVHEAILRLPPDQSMSVILHDLEGVPHERIAAMAGIDHAVARKRHSRALRALERLLGEESAP